MTLHPIPVYFLIYEENFLFFFISVELLFYDKINAHFFKIASFLKCNTIQKYYKKCLSVRNESLYYIEIHAYSQYIFLAV
jgi:hypothetical protein